MAGFAVITALLAQISINLQLHTRADHRSDPRRAPRRRRPRHGQGRGRACSSTGWRGWVGLPFYADHKSGWHAAGRLGSFVGFIAAAAVVGYLAERRQDRTFATSIPAMLAGTAIIYVFGAGWLALDLNIPLSTGTPNAIGLGVTRSSSATASSC